jgi:hypothetical protein
MPNSRSRQIAPQSKETLPQRKTLGPREYRTSEARIPKIIFLLEAEITPVAKLSTLGFWNQTHQAWLTR